MASETFRRLPRAVESSLGFSIKLAGRDLLHYREGDHVMEFGIEPTGPNAGSQLIFYTGRQSGGVRWEPPFEHEPVSRPRHDQIVANILRALAAMDLRPEVV